MRIGTAVLGVVLSCEPGVHPADGGDFHCRPFQCVNGEKQFGLQQRVRREIHEFNDPDFGQFRDAVRAFKERPSGEYPANYDSFAHHHLHSHEAHRHDEFLPYHRKLLLDFETRLQMLANNCSLTLPYWNWAMETGDYHKSVVWTAERYGTLKRGCITDGLAADWHAGDQCVWRDPARYLDNVLPTWDFASKRIARAADYSEVRDLIEEGLGHNSMHCMVHGDFCALTSTRDPLFWLHHAFVDREWYFWQEHRKGDTVTGECGSCNVLSNFSDAEATRWVGMVQEDCVPLPSDTPTVCLSYQQEAHREPSEQLGHPRSSARGYRQFCRCEQQDERWGDTTDLHEVKRQQQAHRERDAAARQLQVEMRHSGEAMLLTGHHH